jgi:hypothetical protein
MVITLGVVGRVLLLKFTVVEIREGELVLAVLEVVLAVLELV